MDATQNLCEESSMMKRMTMKTVAMLAAVTAGGVGWVAVADPFDGPPSAEKLIEKLDSNKDGKLDVNELKAMKDLRAQHRQEMMKKFDANNDGKLDEAEREKLSQEKTAERFKKLDTDGNGALSLQEFQAGKRFHHGRHGRR
jgi:Ca2+-binding EF-hand superfamily protein